MATDVPALSVTVWVALVILGVLMARGAWRGMRIHRTRTALTLLGMKMAGAWFGRNAGLERVLAELGLDAARIAQLRDSGVL